MGFDEDLAKATAEKRAAAIAANEPRLDPLTDFNRLLAEFQEDVLKAVAALKENDVPSQVVLIHSLGSGTSQVRYRSYNRRGWHLGGGLCLFDDGTWKIGGSILKRDQEQAQVRLDSNGSVWWRAKDWESLGASGVAPGETAIWIWNDQYGETPQPSDLRDWGDGKEIAFDIDRGNVDGIASYVSLRGALIAGVADLISSL